MHFRGAIVECAKEVSRILKTWALVEYLRIAEIDEHRFAEGGTISNIFNFDVTVHDIDLMQYPEIPGKLFLVFISLIFILYQGALLHPKLDAVTVEDEIELLVLDKLRSYLEDGGYLGEKVLSDGSEYKFADSNLAALIFVYLHALDCK